MPPRHGQSQLISPVSGLKAASWLASSSSSWGDIRAASEAGRASCCVGCASGCETAFDSACLSSRILGLMESRVGGWVSSEESGVLCLERRETVSLTKIN
jgi:hypothetical protein